jgi:cellulose/xylan binding protein with CBM9 domain
MPESQRPTYTVRRVQLKPDLTGQWDGPAWAGAEELTVGHFYAPSSDHHPLTRAKLLYDGEGIYGIFRVQDRYVVCRNAAFQSKVYEDSCVELFASPAGMPGYINFEMNCRGALLASYITDPRRGEDGSVQGATPLSAEQGGRVKVFGSIGQCIDEELGDETTWHVEFFIPFATFEDFAGPIRAASGQLWRANLSKCADNSSHPHWATWSPLGAKLDFHQPDCFGILRFE